MPVLDDTLNVRVAGQFATAPAPAPLPLSELTALHTAWCLARLARMERFVGRKLTPKEKGRRFRRFMQWGMSHFHGGELFRAKVMSCFSGRWHTITREYRPDVLSGKREDRYWCNCEWGQKRRAAGSAVCMCHHLEAAIEEFGLVMRLETTPATEVRERPAPTERERQMDFG